MLLHQLPFTAVTYYTTVLEGGNIWVMESLLIVYSRAWYFRKYTEMCKASRLCISELSDFSSSVLCTLCMCWQDFLFSVTGILPGTVGLHLGFELQGRITMRLPFVVQFGSVIKNGSCCALSSQQSVKLICAIPFWEQMLEQKLH